MGRPSKSDDGAAPGRSYRFGGRYRFALRLVSRQTGKNETALLEDAIQDLANSLNIGKKHWLEFYDEEEGVSDLRLYANDDYRANLAETEIKRFADAHAQFFYTDKDRKVPRRAFVKVLWPKLKALMKLWRETRNEDPVAVTKEMIRLLKAAGEKDLPKA